MKVVYCISYKAKQGQIQELLVGEVQMLPPTQ